ncbi:CPBP family intramembrane metalloprotease [Flavobacterium tructae]
MLKNTIITFILCLSITMFQVVVYGILKLFINNENTLLLLVTSVSLTILYLSLFYRRSTSVNKYNRIIIFKTIILCITFYSFSSIIYLIFDHYLNTKNTTEAVSFIRILYTVLIGPIEEELLYRGILFALMVPPKKKNSNSQILFSVIFISLLFTVRHYPYSRYTINHFVFSMICCYLYMKFKNILYPILFHVFNNTLVIFSAESVFYNIGANFQILLCLIFFLLFLSQIIKIQFFKNDHTND